MAEGKCITCKWCEPADAQSGMCRFDPPKSTAFMSQQGVGNATLWPTVRLNVDWCRRYEQELVKPASFIPRLVPLEPMKN